MRQSMVSIFFFFFFSGGYTFRIFSCIPDAVHLRYSKVLEVFFFPRRFIIWLFCSFRFFFYPFLLSAWYIFLCQMSSYILAVFIISCISASSSLSFQENTRVLYIHIPNKAPTMRPPASHHETYQSYTNQTCGILLEKQGRAHKLCTPMALIWPSKSRTTTSNIHTAAMWGYGM